VTEVAWFAFGLIVGVLLGLLLAWYSVKDRP